MKAKCAGSKIGIIMSQDEVIGLAKEASKLTQNTSEMPIFTEFLTTIFKAKVSQLVNDLNGGPLNG